MNGFLWRQAEALIGVLLMAGVLAAVASLGTWSVADPSFSHATGNTPVNALGSGGAIFADLAMQFFGLAIVPALVPILIAGFRMARGRGIANRSRRILTWVAGAVLMGFLGGLAGWSTDRQGPDFIAAVIGSIVLLGI